MHRLSMSRENKISSKDTALIKWEYFKKLKNKELYSWYEREIFAKKVAGNTSATLKEVLYFLQFKDADQWMSSYFQYKKYIKVIESNDYIVKFESEYIKFKYFMYIAGYWLLMFMALTPLVIRVGFDYYLNEIYQSLMGGSVIGGIWLIVFPFISVIGAFSSAILAENLKGSKNFVDNFESKAIKIEENPNI
ncbi:hypothetical protein GCM10027155_07310 [Acinetobacter apis]